ncbi:MAG: hypothetical protein QOJ65_1656, partial [Fimbriimonadaceae bacterium]|nr:hypothetical protein [Fimbriimonadaceae bacterium]
QILADAKNKPVEVAKPDDSAAPTHAYNDPAGEAWWTKALALRDQYFAAPRFSPERAAARKAFDAHQEQVLGTGNKFDRIDAATGEKQKAIALDLAEHQVEPTPVEPAPPPPMRDVPPEITSPIPDTPPEVAPVIPDVAAPLVHVDFGTGERIDENSSLEAQFQKAENDYKVQHPEPVSEKPVKTKAPIDPARKAMVDEAFGNPDNYQDLTDLAEKYVQMRKIRNQEAGDLVAGLYQKALTEPGMVDWKTIRDRAWSRFEDIAGRAQKAEAARNGASLDSEVAGGTVADKLGEGTPAEAAAKTRAEEAQTLIEELRTVLSPEELKLVEDIADGNADGRRADVKAVKEKVRAYHESKTKELKAEEPALPDEPVNEHAGDEIPDADRKYAIDRAYKLHAGYEIGDGKDKRAVSVLDAKEYRDFKDRIEEADTLGELDAIHRELEAKTPAADRADDYAFAGDPLSELVLRQASSLVRDQYRLGGPLHEALRRLANITKDSGHRELAIMLQRAINRDARTRVNSAFRSKGVTGHYDAWSKLVEISPFQTPARLEETILHEALHDALLAKVHDYLFNKGKRLTETERSALRQLDALRQDALSHAPQEVRDAAARRGDEAERYHAMVESNAKTGPFYGLLSLREYISEMFTNPEFKKFLDSHKPLTTAPRAERQTYWQRAIQLISHLFGAKPGSILHESLRSSMNLFERPPLQPDESAFSADSVARPDLVDTALSKKKDLLDRATELRDLQLRSRTLRGEEAGKTRPLDEIVREHAATPGDTTLAEKLVTEGGMDKANAAGVARILEREMTPPPVVDPIAQAVKSSQALGIIPGYLDINEPLAKMWAQTKNYFGTFKPGNWWAAWYNAAETKTALFARQKANDVRGSLREAMQRPLKGAEDLKTLDARALGMVVEAQNDPANLDKFASQITAAQAVPGRSRAWTQEARQVLDAITHAKKNFTRLAPVADLYAKITTDQHALENANGVATNFRKGYVPRTQTNESVLSMPFDRSSGSGGTGFKKVRSFDTLADAIEAGRTHDNINAVTSLESRIAKGTRVVNLQKWAESGKNIIDPTTGMPLVADPLITKHPSTGDSITSAPPGYRLEMQGNRTIAVHEGYTGLYDRLTTPSAMGHSVITRGIMTAAGTVKHGMLLFDTFHLGRLAYYQIPLRGKATYGKGLLILDYSSAELTNMERRGELPKGITARDLIARKARAHGLISAGLNVAGAQEAIHAGLVRRIPLVGGFNKLVFDQFQRGGMMETGLIEFDRQRAAYPALSDQQVERMVAKDLNTRFGNLRKEGWLQSDTMRDLAQLILLAPSWNEGLLKSELGAGKQLIGAGVDLAHGRLRAGTLLKGSGTMMLGVFAANQLINYITRGQPTWQNKEEGINAKISAWIPDWIGGGPGFFLNPLTLPAELTHQVMEVMDRGKTKMEALRDVAGYKFGPALRVPYTFMTRTDRFGRALNSDWDVMKEMIADVSPQPISGQSVVSAVQSIGKGQVT